MASQHITTGPNATIPTGMSLIPIRCVITMTPMMLIVPRAAKVTTLGMAIPIKRASGDGWLIRRRRNWCLLRSTGIGCGDQRTLRLSHEVFSA